MSDDLTDEDAMRVLRSVPGSAINSTSLEHQAVAIKVAREWWQAFQPIIRARIATAEVDALERAALRLDEIARLKRQAATTADNARDNEILIKTAHNLEFEAAAIRSLKPKGRE